MDLNRAMLIGRLTRDPEVRNTPSGQTVANFGLATNRVWTDNAGVKQERVDFHNCVVWSKLADIAGQFLTKGRRVYVEGRIETRDWVGQDGVKRYRTEIIISNLIMLDGARGSGQHAAQSSGEPPMPQGSSGYDSGVVEEEIKVEDIPF